MFGWGEESRGGSETGLAGMRRLLIGAAVLVACAAFYAAAPLLTAWSIREAVKAGDSDYLATKVDWERVRATLKPSLASLALTRPEGPASDAAQGGWWERFKSYSAQGAVDRFVDTYVTPTGLPKLASYGRAYREHIKGQYEDTSLPLPERVARFWGRLKRAEFTGIGRFEMELADRLVPTRRYAAVLELEGFQWKLVELRVRTEGAEPAVSARQLSVGGLN